MTADWPSHPLIVDSKQDKSAAFAAADLALAASGTVSLELAANGVPMVIGYDMAPLSRWIIGMMVKTDTVTLVNLVSETRAVPEFLGRDCQPEPLAKALKLSRGQKPDQGGQDMSSFHILCFIHEMGILSKVRLLTHACWALRLMSP